jgi:hypothetical protein
MGDATRLLATLADGHWNDDSTDYAGRTEWWLAGVVLTDIRTALLGRQQPADQRVPSLRGLAVGFGCNAMSSSPA